MTLTNPIDLTEYESPRLSFWTRWDIEGNWDYGQFEVSTNNGSSWIPLEGEYTEPGVGSFQPNGEPLYDGVQSTWVKEEIRLTNYNSSQFKVRFQFRSDGSVTRDGWYVDDIGIIVYTIVPVELTSFTAEARSENVILNWSTATELNNLGFEIERATGNNNLNWVRIGFVEGNRTSTDINNYTFKDDDPLAGTSYYRLKQIDYDGTFRVYDKVQVDFHGVTDYALEQNYPNPFNPSTTIRYSIQVAGKVKLTLYNLLGSEVAVLVNEQQEAGNHTVQFSTDDSGANLGSGIYFYTLNSGSFSQTRKMIVLK
jgi:hypothetical protein